MKKYVSLIACLFVIFPFTLTMGCAGAPEGTEKPAVKEKNQSSAEQPAEKKETTAAEASPVSAAAHTPHEKAAGNRMPLGGGITDAGFRGEYFPNTSFEGEPSFVRRDVRIRHDWKEGEAGKGLPVGGATTPGMKDFPLDDFSIRWSGKIVPRFTETYTFCVTGLDGVRFSLGGRVLVDSLDKGIVTDVTADMKKGEQYDVVFEYVDRAGTGASMAKLMWSSPSVPWEVVDPLSFAQICGHQAAPQTWLVKERADLKREAGSKNIRNLEGLDYKANQFWKKAKPCTEAETDENGWPIVADFLIEVPFQYDGKHMITFKGKADVSVGDFWFGSRVPCVWNTKADGTGESFDKDNSKGLGGMPKLPKGTGYDPGTNTTTAWFDLKGGRGITFLFSDAEREPGKPGITEFHVWGPVSEGSEEHHQPGEILKREARKVFDNFIVNRLHIGSSQNPGWTWDQRTLPSYHCREHAKGWAYCLEEYIMLVNEGGMDWHICCGAGWDEDFMRKFALMTKYGSDGVNPYTRYTENPKYPPLNPNLRIYLEHSNELPWAVYPRFIWDDLRKKYAQNHPDTKILNYDGKCPSANNAMFRYHALRMKQISEAFRSVYNDEMGERARVYCFGQYTAAHMNNMLQFLDNYFNKADPASTYEGEPHPPSYYIWGGGGAIYYGCNNKFGIMQEELMTNGGFEDADVPAGTAALRPDDTGWTFTGNAGICDVKLASAEAVKADAIPAEPAEAPAKQTWVGMKFTVGERGLYVYKLGRWVSKDHHETNFWKRRDVFNMAIYDEKGARMASFYSAPKLATFKPDQYAYWWCAEKAWGKGKFLPAYLEPGKTYYLVSSEPGGKAVDRFFGPVSVTAAEGITVDAAVTGGPKKWAEQPGSTVYGPVNMVFTAEPLKTSEGNVGVPPDCSEEVYYAGWNPKPRNTFFKFGEQCAFLQGDSTMSREFEVKEAGAYWITFNPCGDRLSNGYKKQGWGGWTNTKGNGTIRVKIDDTDVTSRKLLPGGGYESRGKVFHYASTQIIKLEPGKHTVTFERVKSGGGTMFIDEVHLSSEMAFYGGEDSPNFPAGGNAFGQNAATGYHLTAQAECEMAYNWGLVPCTYEGGWAVQGDFDHYSMLAWDDLRYGSENSNEELTKQALRNAFDIWCQKGGFIYAYFYPVQRKISQFDAPLLECVEEMNNRLSAAPEAGTILPGELTVQIPFSEGGIDGYRSSWSDKKTPEELPAWGWKSWVVTSSETKDYTLSLTASGGKCELRVDDMVKVKGAADQNLSCTVKLVAGVHTIKVRALDQQLTITNIKVE